MSLRSVFSRSRQLLGQLIKHKNEFNQKFTDRQCYQKVRRDDSPVIIRLSSNLFHRYDSGAPFKRFASMLRYRTTATMRLMAYRNLGRGSMFAFVGISMVGTGVDALWESKSCMKKDDCYEDFCSKIRNSFKGMKQESTPEVPDHISGYEFHKEPLGNGCNGLIFAARVKEEVVHPNDEDRCTVVEEASVSDTEHKDNYPIAIKMAFNFFASSNSDDIFREYERELVPLNVSATAGKMTSMQLSQDGGLKHPNIVALYFAFVDGTFPRLDYIRQHHPACLPSDLSPGHGLGRNMTLFVGMKRYDMNLKQYLDRFGGQSERVTMLMLAQLLEGVAYLVSQGIAHRDLKSDNILVKNQVGACRLIITDFGCCLAQDDRSLSLPYTSSYVDRGGNSALMAPEVKSAIPGENTTISYSKSDAWAVGTIAYEIVGLPNPFSVSQTTGSTCLDSRSYKETDLPGFGNTEHQLTRMVCLMLLKRNPTERLCAEVAANVLHLFLWQPQYWKIASWSAGHVIPTREQIIDWLAMLYADLCLRRVGMDEHAASVDTDDITEDDLCRTYLRRVHLDSVMEAVNISQTHIINDFLTSGYYVSPSKL